MKTRIAALVLLLLVWAVIAYGNRQVAPVEVSAPTVRSE